MPQHTTFDRTRTSACISLSLIIVFAGMSAAFARPATKNWQPPRTAFGHPDLQGNWTNSTLTTLERPDQFGDRLVLTAQEAAAIENAEAQTMAAANAPTNPKFTIKDLPHDCGRGFTGVNCGYNKFWIDPGTQVMEINGEKRSSIIVDPPNGKIPPLTDTARQRLAARMQRMRGGGSADGPELRSLGERCITSFGSSAGPPMLPSLYNNLYQIAQTKDAVMILVEMVHDARIIRLNDKHKPAHIKQWMGDSIGRWEGDTLVVETVNIRPEQAFRGASEHLKVTERFTRIAPDKIVYKFTIEDPNTFTQPWSGEVAMNATDSPLYEYACHEGNYALPGILAGERQKEREATAQAASDD